MPVSEFSRPREVEEYSSQAPHSGGMPTSLQYTLGGLVVSLLTAGVTGVTYRKAAKNETRIAELEDRMLATEQARKQFFEQIATHLTQTLHTVVEQGIAQIVARMQGHPHFQQAPPPQGPPPPGTFYPNWSHVPHQQGPHNHGPQA